VIFPAEMSPLGMIPHDGIYRDGGLPGYDAGLTGEMT
jgi:hypothetical protein